MSGSGILKVLFFLIFEKEVGFDLFHLDYVNAFHVNALRLLSL